MSDLQHARGCAARLQVDGPALLLHVLGLFDDVGHDRLRWLLEVDPCAAAPRDGLDDAGWRARVD
jgi:hypothetical protein